MYDFNGCIYLDHGDALSLLRESPGKNLVRNFVRENNLTADSYKSYGEFDLGSYGRIDSVIQLMPSSIRVGVEIKCRSEDLLNDHKFFEKYLASGVCNYYYLVTISDTLALQGFLKYKGTPIGVASLASGNVLKVAQMMEASDHGKKWFADETVERSIWNPCSKNVNQYIHDDEISLL